MSLEDDLNAQINEIFKRKWIIRSGRTVPEPNDVGLLNNAVELPEATILYADLSDSTKMVNNLPWQAATDIYKSFLLCAARVIRAEGGKIRAYDGDRIMAVFVGKTKETSAARTALKINYCVTRLVNPLYNRRYPSSSHEIRHVVGIDTSTIRVARTGFRGANDLVWVGRAANYAAKLCSLTEKYSSYITADVYNKLDDSIKYGSNHELMWEQRNWPEMNYMNIYQSNWRYKV